MADPIQALKDGAKMLWAHGAGNGNFAIAAARAGARVMATDLTAQMVLGVGRRLVTEHCRSVVGGTVLDNEYLVVMARKS